MHYFPACLPLRIQSSSWVCAPLGFNCPLPPPCLGIAQVGLLSSLHYNRSPTWANTEDSICTNLQFSCNIPASCHLNQIQAQHVFLPTKGKGCSTSTWVGQPQRGGHRASNLTVNQVSKENEASGSNPLSIPFSLLKLIENCTLSVFQN